MNDFSLFYFYDIDYGPFCKSVLELKSNLSKILPVNCKFISVRLVSFFFAVKVRLKHLKFEICQFKLE